jgi:hypothetical protein
MADVSMGCLTEYPWGRFNSLCFFVQNNTRTSSISTTFVFNVGFEGLTAVGMKRYRLWDITPCSLLKINRFFEGTYRLQLQSRRISQARNQREAGSKQSNRLAELIEFKLITVYQLRLLNET